MALTCGSIDQSGNSPEAFLRNADLNGVRDRITVTTGNMTRCPTKMACSCS